MRRSRTAAALAGLRGVLPLLPGTALFGTIYGAAARSAGIPVPLVQAMSAVIFAGSAQFAIVQLVAVGAPAVALVLTGAILNLRHVLYSASLAPTLRSRPFTWRALLAYLLTDEMFGVVSARPIKVLPERERTWFAAGVGGGLWVTWQASTFIGLVAGSRIPSSWSLDFTATLTFMALMVPLLTGRASLAAALASAAVTIFLLHVPLRLGLVAAACMGVLAGLLMEGQGRSHGSASIRGKPVIPGTREEQGT
jgi:predicted branched-subunit amino acid permease